MNKEDIYLNEEIEYGFGKKFCFKFQGICSSLNVDKDKINKQLYNFIYNKNNHQNMIDNVTFFRTILNDYEEKILTIYINENGIEESVRYDNGVLTSFERIEYNAFKIEFNLKNGFHISFLDYSLEKNEKIKNKFNKIIDYISVLNNIIPMQLNHDSKLLIEIYRLFYGENPDFSSSYINDKIQTMMFILSEYGICLNNDYKFLLSKCKKIPISLNLQELVSKLYPLGKIENNCLIKIAPGYEKKIKTIRNYINECVTSEEKKDEFLMNISRIMYAKNYQLSFNCNNKEIVDFTQCTNDVVERYNKLVKKIENN